MITSEYKDTLIEIQDHSKYCSRDILFKIPVGDVKKIINQGLPDETIQPHEFNEFYQVRLAKDKLGKEYLVLNMTYYYETLASKEDIETEIKKCAKERIENVKQNLNLLCSKYEISMEELMEMIK